jgi:ferritin-like metal-binding protein YciE
VERSKVSYPAIDGIIKKANEVAGEVDDKQVLDAALIAAAQLSSTMKWHGMVDDCAIILRENLKEEKAADQKLTDIAESQVNVEASMSP